MQCSPDIDMLSQSYKLIKKGKDMYHRKGHTCTLNNEQLYVILLLINGC